MRRVRENRSNASPVGARTTRGCYEMIYAARMRVAELRAVFLVVAVWSSLLSKLAFADAVPPPPEHCPPGQVAVTSHHGPECLPKASTKCRPGYCAERGGSRLPARNEAEAYAQDPPVAVERPAPLAPTPPVATAKPSASTRPTESAARPNGANTSGGRNKGCTMSSTPDLAGWLVAPLLVAATLRRRRRGVQARSTEPATNSALDPRGSDGNGRRVFP
jgi:MYXO-CTERM domain-containing protein